MCGFVNALGISRGASILRPSARVMLNCCLSRSVPAHDPFRRSRCQIGNTSAAAIRLNSTPAITIFVSSLMCECTHASGKWFALYSHGCRVRTGVGDTQMLLDRNNMLVGTNRYA